VVTQEVTPSLNVYYKNTRIKQYHKENRALRTETTINNSYDFAVGKRLTNLLKLRAIGFAANRKLLEVERLSHDCILSEDTAAADKTTAAFFMGFPFTKIKRQAKAFCRLNPVTLCPLLVPSRGTPNPKKPQIRNSELYVRIRQWAEATAKFKLGQGVQFHFLEGCTTCAISARCSTTRSPCPIRHAIMHGSVAGSSAQRGHASAR
jgi:hypothetical protein